MPTCPTCATPLATHAEVPGGGRCPTCAGQLLPFAFVRKEAPAGAIDGLWAELLAAPVGRRPCPACAAPMQAVFRRGVELDGCGACHHVWLDRGEREGLRRAAAGASDHQMTEMEARRIVATAEAQAIGDAHRERERVRRAAWWLDGITDLLWFLD